MYLLCSVGSFGLRRSCTEVRRPTFFGGGGGKAGNLSANVMATFFGLVACRRLSSSEGAPAGFRGIFCARPRSRGRCQAQEERRTRCCSHCCCSSSPKTLLEHPPRRTTFYMPLSRKKLPWHYYLWRDRFPGLHKTTKKSAAEPRYMTFEAQNFLLNEEDT